jgi:hypothetical protein
LICGQYPIFIKELNEQAPCLQDLPVRQDVPTDGADHAEVADAATTKVAAPKKKAHWAVPEPSGVSRSYGRGSWENVGVEGRAVLFHYSWLGSQSSNIYIYIKIFGFKA